MLKLSKSYLILQRINRTNSRFLGKIRNEHKKDFFDVPLRKTGGYNFRTSEYIAETPAAGVLSGLKSGIIPAARFTARVVISSSSTAIRADLSKTGVTFANDAELFTGVKNNPRKVTGISENDLIPFEEHISNTFTIPAPRLFCRKHLS